MVETTAANPELLADQVSQLLVQPLEATSVVLASGPRIFDTSGVLRIPKLVSGATAGFTGEGSEIPATADVDFDELILMPTDRKSLKTILTFTNELVRQSVIGIDAVLRARLVKDVSDALDTALLTGDGSSDSITGIVEQANTIPAELDVTDSESLPDAIGLLNARRSRRIGGWSTEVTSWRSGSSRKPPSPASICSSRTSPGMPPIGCSACPSP